MNGDSHIGEYAHAHDYAKSWVVRCAGTSGMYPAFSFCHVAFTISPSPSLLCPFLCQIRYGIKRIEDTLPRMYQVCWHVHRHHADMQTCSQACRHANMLTGMQACKYAEGHQSSLQTTGPRNCPLTTLDYIPWAQACMSSMNARCFGCTYVCDMNCLCPALLLRACLTLHASFPYAVPLLRPSLK